MAEENLGTAVLSIVVDSKGLEESLTKAKQQIQKTSRELQRSLTAAPINPVTGRSLRNERNDPIKAAIQQRRADQRALQTASGSGLGQFLRDVAAREEGEKRVAAERVKGYKQAEFAEKTLQALTEKRAGTAARAAGGGVGGRVGGAVGSALIGGGFPLLFGQGVGAAAGGAAGGAIGGAIGGQFGFGLSIVGTIVGAAFDEALNKGKTLAAGLDDPIGKFGELQQAALLSSSAVEKNISALIEQGRNAEAAALIQLDLAQRYGDTTELDGLRSAYDELGRSFNQLSVVTAKYVAGPLTEFISKLASSFQAVSSRSLFEERLNGAPREVEAEARARVRSAAGELSGSGLSTAEVANKAYAEGLALLDQRLGKTKEVAAAELALATAKQRQNKLDNLTTQQIQAQVQGYDLLNLRLEKQRIETQKLQDLQAAPAEKAGGINRKALEDTVKVEAQINNLLQDRAAQRGLEAAQDNLKLQSIREQITATQALGEAERGVTRDTLGTVQAIQQGINEAKRREQEIGAQITAARQRGGDAGEQEASRLVGEQKVAAEETKLKLTEGAQSLRDAGAQLVKDSEQTQINLQKLREGNLRFQTPEERQRTIDTLNQQVQAEADRRGVRITFRGTPEEILREKRGFVDFGREERGLIKQGEQLATAIAVANQGLVNINTQLLNSNTTLATSVDNLANKNWAVNVAVSGAQAAVYGEVVNGAVSP